MEEEVEVKGGVKVVEVKVWGGEKEMSPSPVGKRWREILRTEEDE